MDKTETRAIVALPEKLLFELDAIALGAYVKLKYLCEKEPDKMYKASWDALAFTAITERTLKMLQAKGLIRWMQNRNMQLIQMMEP